MKFSWTNRVSLAFIALLTVAVGCKDYNDLELDPINSGSADYSKYVAVGNSLTAGYQSSSLYESAQQYSFPNLIARQLRIENFEQPLISDPGIGGRLGLDGSLGSFTPTSEQGSPINVSLNRPYDNLGIPGALLADFTGTDLPGLPYSARQANNPFFNVVLRDQGNTQAAQLAASNPSFITFWLGNNDVLGYVTSGGVQPYIPSTSFNQLYQASAAQLASTGASVAVYNVPDVSAIPYVFFVNTTLINDGTLTAKNDLTLGIDAIPGDPNIYIEITDPAQPGVVTDTVAMKAHAPSQGQVGDFFLLPAASYLSQQVLVNATSRNSPIPNQYVLDAGELTQASTLVAQYNGHISQIANANGFTLIDINQFFNEVIAQGYYETEHGEQFRPVPGELFSLDAVHPSNKGQAIIANQTIEKLNEVYGSNIPTVDVRTIPRGIPVTDPTN
ncbi:MAG: SGNH/GDSL hydrolase family protein [Bacteroidota bacterium]